MDENWLSFQQEGMECLSLETFKSSLGVSLTVAVPPHPEIMYLMWELLGEVP